MTHGSWARFGMQQTPWVDFEESVYRYRFQGTVFAEREGFLSSSDVGASFHYNLPGNYGDVHAGVYNGENYNRRGSQRPEGVHGPRHAPAAAREPAAARPAGHRLLRPGRLREGRRAPARIVAATFEHPYVNAAFEYLDTQDQTRAQRRRRSRAQGWSFWATPKSPDNIGWEGLSASITSSPTRSVDAAQRIA